MTIIIILAFWPDKLFVSAVFGSVDITPQDLGKKNWDIRSVSENTLIRYEAGSHFILSFTIK